MFSQFFINCFLLQAENADMLGSVWEFPRSRLRLQTVLGEGNFGKVWKAEADDICGYDGTILVAVKTVKVINISRGNDLGMPSSV